jgi:hypothetical protein
MEKYGQELLRHAADYKTKLDNGWLLSVRFEVGDKDRTERLFYVTEEDLVYLHKQLSISIGAFGLPLIGDKIATEKSFNRVKERYIKTEEPKEVTIILRNGI